MKRRSRGRLKFVFAAGCTGLLRPQRKLYLDIEVGPWRAVRKISSQTIGKDKTLTRQR